MFAGMNRDPLDIAARALFFRLIAVNFFSGAAVFEWVACLFRKAFPFIIIFFVPLLLLL